MELYALSLAPGPLRFTWFPKEMENGARAETIAD